MLFLSQMQTVYAYLLSSYIYIAVKSVAPSLKNYLVSDFATIAIALATFFTALFSLLFLLYVAL